MSIDLNILKRVLRQERLKREAQVGKPRSHTYGGKPNPKESRRSWKQSRNDG